MAIFNVKITFIVNVTDSYYQFAWKTYSYTWYRRFFSEKDRKNNKHKKQHETIWANNNLEQIKAFVKYLANVFKPFPSLINIFTFKILQLDLKDDRQQRSQNLPKLLCMDPSRWLFPIHKGGFLCRRNYLSNLF